MPLVELVQERLHELGDILHPLAQRRHRDRQDVEPIVEVLAQGAVLQGLQRVLVGGRHDPDVDVRLALGAEPSQVGRMIFADGMRLALFGVVPGVLGAYAAARGMSALLFGVAPSDPVTFAAGVGVALLMTLAGSLVPTIRAVRVSPMSVLRSE